VGERKERREKREERLEKEKEISCLFLFIYYQQSYDFMTLFNPITSLKGIH
jgi:hypothetical protein